MADLCRYFDHAAATPPHDDALAASHEAAISFYGNPSAMHPQGNRSRTELNRLKNQFNDLLGCDDGRLVLTSGGTESNNLVINNYLRSYPNKRIAIAVNAHASMWYPAEYAADRVIILPITPTGALDLDALKTLTSKEVSLCCINHVCNETGVIQDAALISELCLRKGIPLLIDGVQALGRVDVDLASIECDYYTFSGHKFGGPHGIGGSVFRGNACQPTLRGGDQEWHMRAGTENLAGLAGATKALELSIANIAIRTQQNITCISALLEALKQAGIRFLLNSPPDSFASGILSLSFPGWKSQAIAADLMLQGVSVATGSACHADRDEPSRVIMALGRQERDALGTIRISLGRDCTREDIMALASAMNFLAP